MATHSSVLARRISWAEDPAGYGPQGHRVTESHTTKANEHTRASC